MAVSNKINSYIQNSLIRGKLCGWKKSSITVFISPIISTEQVNKELMYSLVERSISAWNTTLQNNSINVNFHIIHNAHQADIIVHWIKVGRVYEGMCKYICVINDEIKKISIDIGLPNIYSGKDTTDLSIYCAIMHEFGHALGLGHGIDVDDIMFVPHQKNISVPSENDVFVLKEIYKN